ncbi:unnamed protein product [Arabidopsis lyrata]|uniref:Predicted protein n=1 Tax=Arabidopsis lyrata subsp. lyrata TaxID=81972 RepID=D7LDH5_ARALL|nr:uncharacterized protein LOC9316859 [Arabidopsis lyrata subsp. lyrata]EFH57051.1 predicted protein [Arabidopsis lyrata subsp. lyrata]CAH8263700.1 unnamed protein product [Arabidopsis lyrata]|eukprot:XP_002880792.1 uncharacterized protein LOC9316859 [Arabidopsis lyrata subsp. lyrata]
MGEDLYKIEDFSEPITPVEGAKMGVFWDLHGFPFPDGVSPDWIYQKIESALFKIGFCGKMSIWAYVDDENMSSWGKFLGKKTWKARLHFLPGGIRPDKRMFSDILIWEKDSPVDFPEPASVVVVSDKVKCDPYFLDMLSSMDMGRHYHVYLVDPTKRVPPEDSGWPILLFVEMQSFARKRGREDENPTKRSRADVGNQG